MEQRFGADFGGVRIHDDARANQAARQIDAQAFTTGKNIYFGSDRYQPGTSQGDRLLAHELTHVAQQSGGSSKHVRRKLVVSGPTNATGPNRDPAADIPPTARTSMVRVLVQQLCDGFTVVGISAADSSGEVVMESADCSEASTVASGAKPLGCCCLCVMVNSPNTWKIRITEERGPLTDPGNRDILIPPNTSAFQSGHWTARDTRVMRPRVITFAHELCGHAALLELQAHPPPGSRADSTRHDPTVQIERGVWLEQGLPAADRRALAAEGTHRGESFQRAVVIKFPFNVRTVSSLPADERRKLSTAKNVILNNNRWVEIFGHSDPVGSAAAKKQVSEQRAQNVQAELVRLGVDDVSPGRGGVGGRRFVKVEGLSDSQPLTGQPHDEWRRVEIFTASFPAGVSVPPPGTPTAVTAVPPPATAGASFRTGDSCVRLIIGEAWQQSFQ